MCPSLIQIGLCTNKQTNRQTLRK